MELLACGYPNLDLYKSFSVITDEGEKHFDDSHSFEIFGSFGAESVLMVDGELFTKTTFPQYLTWQKLGDTVIIKTEKYSQKTRRFTSG